MCVCVYVYILAKTKYLHKNKKISDSLWGYLAGQIEKEKTAFINKKTKSTLSFFLLSEVKISVRFKYTSAL